jgi:DUF1680 family protein
MSQPAPTAPADTLDALQVVVDISRSPYAKLRPVSLTAVRLNDAFWTPRLRTNEEVTIPTQYPNLQDRLDNFRRVSGKKPDIAFQGIYFNDSDVYKWLEAASWVLARGDNPELKSMVDEAVEEVRGAQRPDGYLNTYFALEREDERWTNFDLHEMYCAGHLFQAAVAHHRATGETSLLGVATRFADHICETFGPASEGKREAVDGHEEVKLGLVELYRVTGETRYLEQAQFFIEARGKGLLGRPYGHFNPEYAQDHLPIREMPAVVGHAVRALYYTAGVADVYAETGDEGYLNALKRLWENMTLKRMYVTGGLGSRYEGEAFGKDYELPNERAYTETCAAIASVMWNWRLLALGGDARYADLMEWTLYNAVLPGLSLDGQHYFYQNPLADDGSHRRQAWFGCACCPPNVARLLASLPSYFYSVSDDALWVHLYAQGSLETTLENGETVVLEQATRYPWDGEVTLTLRAEGTFTLKLRIPAWAEGATVQVNGEAGEQATAGSYHSLSRPWRAGDTVQLQLPMPVRYLEAHPYLFENTGRVALARGPILYCAEGIDQDVADVRDLIVPTEADAVEVVPSDELGGVVILKATASAESPGDAGYLYRTAGPSRPAPVPAALVAVPYYSWANREAGPMQVWLRRR